MITAVDTNVLIDVLSADERFGQSSRDALADCLGGGTVVVCEVVWAETAASFPDVLSAEQALSSLGARFSATNQLAAGHAAQAWRSYRRRGGSRQRVIADFLIGAHAGAQADRLLTRDRGFYRTYFAGVQLLDPTAVR